MKNSGHSGSETGDLLIITEKHKNMLQLMELLCAMGKECRLSQPSLYTTILQCLRHFVYHNWGCFGCLLSRGLGWNGGPFLHSKALSDPKCARIQKLRSMHSQTSQPQSIKASELDSVVNNKPTGHEAGKCMCWGFWGKLEKLWGHRYESRYVVYIKDIFKD